MKYIEYISPHKIPKEIMENPLPEGTQVRDISGWSDTSGLLPVSGRNLVENPFIYNTTFRIPIEHWIKTLKQDDLVEVSDDGIEWFPRHFSHKSMSGVYAYTNLKNSKDGAAPYHWNNVRPLSVKGKEFTDNKSIDCYLDFNVQYEMYISKEEIINKIKVTDGFWLTKAGYVVEIKKRKAVNADLCPGLNVYGKSATENTCGAWIWHINGTIGGMDKQSTEDLQLIEKLDIESIPEPPEGYKHFGGYPTYRTPKHGEYYMLGNSNNIVKHNSGNGNHFGGRFIFEKIKIEFKENIPDLPEGFEWDGGIPTLRFPRRGEWYIDSELNPYKAGVDYTKHERYIIKPLNSEEIPQQKEEMKEEVMKEPKHFEGYRVLEPHEIVMEGDFIGTPAGLVAFSSNGRTKAGNCSFNIYRKIDMTNNTNSYVARYRITQDENGNRKWILENPPDKVDSVEVTTKGTFVEVGGETLGVDVNTPVTVASYSSGKSTVFFEGYEHRKLEVGENLRLGDAKLTNKGLVRIKSTNQTVVKEGNKIYRRIHENGSDMILCYDKKINRQVWKDYPKGVSGFVGLRIPQKPIARVLNYGYLNPLRKTRIFLGKMLPFAILHGTIAAASVGGYYAFNHVELPFEIEWKENVEKRAD